MKTLPVETAPTQVLRALLKGYQVKIGNERYVLAETFELCIAGSDMEGHEVGYKVDMSLGTFIRMCRQMTDEERIDLAGGRAILKPKPIG
jgi:hypothetical protein